MGRNDAGAAPSRGRSPPRPRTEDWPQRDGAQPDPAWTAQNCCLSVAGPLARRVGFAVPTQTAPEVFEQTVALAHWPVRAVGTSGTD
eukprot:3298724-Prymnesium_polylepis.1